MARVVGLARGTDDEVIEVPGETKVEVVGKGIDELDLVAFDVGAAEPAAPLAGADELGIAVGVESAVVVIGHGVEPGIGFETLIAVEELPSVFASGAADVDTRAPTR